MLPKTDIIGVILAGGKSSRMGVDKATLSTDKRTLLQQMESLLITSGIHAVAINDTHHIADMITGKGPLGGVHITLKTFQENHSYLIYVPIDMPALTPDLIQQLIHAPAEYDVVRFADYILPFRLKADIAVVHIIEKILAGEKGYALHAFQERFTIKKLAVNPNDSSHFANINTQEDWRHYQERIKTTLNNKIKRC
jgi:molybdopterin-guanine dinucleotide biosynthesis protein A